MDLWWLCVYALFDLINKKLQDLRDAMSQDSLARRIGLSSANDRKWHIEPSCAITGDGLFQGLDWLSSMVETY
jgi:hypothetical protein